MVQARRRPAVPFAPWYTATYSGPLIPMPTWTENPPFVHRHLPELGSAVERLRFPPLCLSGNSGNGWLIDNRETRYFHFHGVNVGTCIKQLKRDPKTRATSQTGHVVSECIVRYGNSFDLLPKVSHSVSRYITSVSTEWDHLLHQEEEEEGFEILGAWYWKLEDKNTIHK